MKGYFFQSIHLLIVAVVVLAPTSSKACFPCCLEVTGAIVQALPTLIEVGGTLLNTVCAQETHKDLEALKETDPNAFTLLYKLSSKRDLKPNLKRKTMEEALKLLQESGLISSTGKVDPTVKALIRHLVEIEEGDKEEKITSDRLKLMPFEEALEKKIITPREKKLISPGRNKSICASADNQAVPKKN